MNPDLYQFLTEFDFNQKAALCSILHHSGSVPRKDHPLMMVLEDGSTLGTVGGGALEHQAGVASMEVLKTGLPQLLQSSMSGTDLSKDAGICGGSVKLLVEEFTPALQRLWQRVPIFSDPAIPCLMITGYDPEAKETVFHFAVTEDQLPEVPRFLRDAAETAFQRRASTNLRKDEKVILLRYFAPAPVLHIFGAGHVGSAVADLADFLKIAVKIYDDRAELANPERFPFARTVSTDPLGDLKKNSHFGEQDMVLVSTRNHKSDLQIMRWLLGMNLPYIGLMSSRRKWQLIADALLNEGISQEKIEAVFAPVGLDIGADTVPEIALSILTEIVFHQKKQCASPLALREK
ncbi:MAG: XdhC family protein [FCB group bacterium]|nr:XdhC family protein [FCB group bacterium]